MSSNFTKISHWKLQDHIISFVVQNVYLRSIYIPLYNLVKDYILKKKTQKNKMNCELMLTYDTPALQQSGSRNLMGPKTIPTIWGTYMKLVTKYQISTINSCWEKWTKYGYIHNVCSMCIKINKVGKQEVGIWRVQKRFPQYGIPIWSLWPNIRFLSSIVA
jgi:hypothetical protein